MERNKGKGKREVRTRVDGVQNAVGDFACGKLGLFFQTVSLCTGFVLFFLVGFVDVIKRHYCCCCFSEGEKRENEKDKASITHR